MTNCFGEKYRELKPVNGFRIRMVWKHNGKRLYEVCDDEFFYEGFDTLAEAREWASRN